MKEVQSGNLSLAPTGGKVAVGRIGGAGRGGGGSAWEDRQQDVDSYDYLLRGNFGSGVARPEGCRSCYHIVEKSIITTQNHCLEP